VTSQDEKPKVLWEKTVDELGDLLMNLQKEQFNLRFRLVGGHKEGIGRVRLVRRSIARIKTILTVKKCTVKFPIPSVTS
jgi:large subunit ribosomal protein L29